jgi:hypothetical protein
MKIRPVGAELILWTDGQTNTHDEANTRFSRRRLKIQSYKLLHFEINCNLTN